MAVSAGGTKKRQQRDIAAAHGYWRDYKESKRGRRPTEREKRQEPRASRTSCKRHVKTDKKYAEALLREGVDAMLGGDVETGKTILRDYIKATVGFEKLGKATGAPPKSLIRMFGPRDNPQARDLFNVIDCLQKRAGVRLHVTV